MGRLSGWIRYFFPLFLVGAFLLPLVGGYRAIVARREQILNRQAFQTLGAVSTNLKLEIRSLNDKLRSVAEAKTTLPNVKAYSDHYLEGVDLSVSPSSENRTENLLAVESTPDSDRSLLLTVATGAWHAKLPLTKLLDRIVPNPEPAVFEAILLTDSLGTVLARKAWVGAPAVTELGDLPQTDSLAIPSSIPFSFPTAITDPMVTSVNPGSAASARQESRFTPLATIRRTTHLAGAEYVLFVQPTEVTFISGVSRRSFVLVGLAPTSRLREMSTDFPNLRTTAVLLTLLAILGILWPLIRLKTMSSREPLTMFSGRIMILGAFASLALLCLLFLSWGFGITLRQRTHFRLEALADRIQRNVSTEIRDSICTMQVLGDKLKVQSRDTMNVADLSGPDSHAPGYLCKPGASRSRTDQSPPDSSRPNPFFFEQMVLRGPKSLGSKELVEIKKVSARAIPTPIRKGPRAEYSGFSGLGDGDGQYHIHQPKHPDETRKPANLVFDMEPLLFLRNRRVADSDRNA